MSQEIETTQDHKTRRTLPGLLIFLLKELLRKKKWILLPLWVLLAAIALILFLTGSPAILPAIYLIGF
ncbi:MAG: hypothetical protein PHW04_14810 [Candidatus Wallbacteria bacterium]|nr:hypothetical protein [Candidatus Wallbacteria bacterium]